MKIWVYLDGRQQGPFEMEQLLDMPVDENTKVWFEGLPKWYPAGSLPQMRPLFDGSLLHRDPEEHVHVEVYQEEPVPGLETEEDTTELREDTKAEEPAPQGKYAPGRRFDRRELPDEPCPTTYLGWTIALTICCCSPVSLAALIASIFVTSYYNQGKVDKARKASEVAAWLIMVAVALGFFPVMLMSMYMQ